MKDGKVSRTYVYITYSERTNTCTYTPNMGSPSKKIATHASRSLRFPAAALNGAMAAIAFLKGNLLENGFQQVV